MVGDNADHTLSDSRFGSSLSCTLPAGLASARLVAWNEHCNSTLLLQHCRGWIDLILGLEISSVLLESYHLRLNPLSKGEGIGLSSGFHGDKLASRLSPHELAKICRRK